MSFLEKIGLKHKKSHSDIPPPPQPAKAKPAAEAPQKEPSKPKIEDLPSRSSKSDDAPKAPPMPPKAEHKPAPPPPKPAPKKEPEKKPEHKPAPPPPKLTEQKEPEKKPAAPEEKPLPKIEDKPEQKLNREDLRKAFDDVPPIKTPQKLEATATVDDNAIKNFDVDSMVLPEEDKDESEDLPFKQVQPSEPKAPIPEAKKREAPQGLYISIDIYDDIQQRVADLKKQVASAGSDIDEILADRDKEDEAFSAFIKDLEKIQDDLIHIDEDLFTQQ